MPVTEGCVVFSAAGHDAGGFYAVVKACEGFVWLADGRRRKLEAPKRKSVKHIRKTNTTLELSGATNKSLREALAAFQSQEGGH